MPHPEAPVESSLPQLGSAFRAAIAHPAVTEFVRRSLQIREPACALGLPRRVSPHVLTRWPSGPHVRVKLGRGAQFDATSCEVALPGEQAVELVDRILGGTGRGLAASKVGLPSAAECGVLAYFAARCIRASGADLRVQDVTLEPLSLAATHAVLWPIRVAASDDLKLDLKLIFPGTADCPQTPLSARLALADTLPEAQLMGLCAGDLLVGEAWSLHSTTAGMSGLLELSVPGSAERAQIALEGGLLRHTRGALTARTSQTAELVIAELTLGFAELADLLGEACIPCPELGQAALEIRGSVVARGRLVRFLGQLALEVEERSSAREQNIADHSMP
jgi:hypothetical protein